MSGRIVVGMSGGVDSSVAAARLVAEGYEVIGITMHLAGSESRCCSLDDADDARRVADGLGIRFYVANYKDRFRAEVMEPFADAYLAGQTPIPCVACNKRFKFHHLLERARALGADAVATGHYARRVDPAGGGPPELWRARDRDKDQSYFLFNLEPEQLRHVQFPLGDLTKSEVRAQARELGLATADKPESQEICFVPEGRYADVVEQIRPGALRGRGEIVDGEGRVLGEHPGIHHFTVGQRKGLGLGSRGGGEKRYVQAIDAERNRVIVGDETALGCEGLSVGHASWVAGRAPSAPFNARVHVRYRHEGAPARVSPGVDGGAQVVFDAPVRAVSPGQAAVFYDGERLLGGGWIRTTARAVDPAKSAVA